MSIAVLASGAAEHGAPDFPILSALIAVQSLFIMSGVLKLVPLTGVTLPFISYGGSSLLINFVVIGLLLRLSTVDG